MAKAIAPQLFEKVLIMQSVFAAWPRRGARWSESKQWLEDATDGLAEFEAHEHPYIGEKPA